MLEEIIFVYDEIIILVQYLSLVEAGLEKIILGCYLGPGNFVFDSGLYGFTGTGWSRGNRSGRRR